MFLSQIKQHIPEACLRKTRDLLDTPKIFKTVYLNTTAIINAAPVIVLGHQKSGTSVVAALLGEATGKSVTIDIVPKKSGIVPFFREDLFKIDFVLRDFILANPLYFATDIIKEPDLTFHYEGLANYFPQAKFVYVIRDPRQTIRSILNRLELPGDVQTLNASHRKSLRQLKLWEPIIEGNFPLVSGETYIENLAFRWNLAAEIYLQHSDNMKLIRYEDFKENKVDTIVRLARQTELKPITDISDKVNEQYQPRGDSEVPLIDFFGADNLNRIEAICSDRMQHFGYEIQ